MGEDTDVDEQTEGTDDETPEGNDDKVPKGYDYKLPKGYDYKLPAGNDDKPPVIDNLGEKNRYKLKTPIIKPVETLTRSPDGKHVIKWTRKNGGCVRTTRRKRLRKKKKKSHRKKKKSSRGKKYI
jgi:hypothetical protein